MSKTATQSRGEYDVYSAFILLLTLVLESLEQMMLSPIPPQSML